MHHNNPNQLRSPICNFVPSYSSYDGLGGSFAGGLSNLIETIIRLIRGLRW